MPGPRLLFALMWCGVQLHAQASIREVNFKDFRYPLSGSPLGHDSLEWMGVSLAGREGRSIRLAHGKDLVADSSFMIDGKRYTQYRGFSLQSVHYADLTGDGKEEAIVDILYQSGGTQTTNYVYIYSVEQRQPKLLAYCHTGSRGDAGLFDVNGKDGLLVFRLFDPSRREGACCSSGILTLRYRWQSDAFLQVGPATRHTLPPLEEHPIR